MSREYFLFYAEANIVCVILIGIMLFHDLRKVSRQEKQMLFDYAVSAHIAYFISDTFWAAVLSGALPCARWLVLLLNLSNFVLLSSIAFFWFFYVAECVGVPLWRDRYTNRRRMNLIRLPLLGTIAVLVVAYLVHPDYWISPAGEVASAYYPLLIAAPVIYIIMSMICAVSQARKQSSPILRHQFILVGIYPLSVVVFGLLQLYALHIPLFCFGLTIMLFLFYIQAMESRISLDPMTGLNNRGQLMRYVSQSSNLRREGLRTYAVMADAKSF